MPSESVNLELVFRPVKSTHMVEARDISMKHASYIECVLRLPGKADIELEPWKPDEKAKNKGKCHFEYSGKGLYVDYSCRLIWHSTGLACDQRGTGKWIFTAKARWAWKSRLGYMMRNRRSPFARNRRMSRDPSRWLIGKMRGQAEILSI